MGNFINKEWSQHFDNTSSAETSIAEEPDTASKSSESRVHRTASSLKKRLSNIDINQQRGGGGGGSSEEYSRVNPNYQTTPVASNKMSMAEFDPRSPSSDIVRTPIFLVAENGEAKKSSSNQGKNSNLINDPRSPAFDYNRTPIHVNNGKKDRVSVASSSNTNHNSNEEDLAANEISMDSSLISDSSILLQQVPENGSTGVNSSMSDSPTTAGFKTTANASNLPRHILQRKQVEKLKKKKVVDKENNQD
jgi:hypothetical protein